MGGVGGGGGGGGGGHARCFVLFFCLSFFFFSQPPSSVTMQSVASQVGDKRQTFQGKKEKKKVQCDSVCFFDSATAVSQQVLNLAA